MPATGQRGKVVVALYRAALRSARRFEKYSPRALAECEMQSELEAFRFDRMKRTASGFLLSQYVRDHFRNHLHETDAERIEELMDSGFLALRKIDSLGCESKAPDPNCRQPRAVQRNRTAP